MRLRRLPHTLSLLFLAALSQQAAASGYHFGTQSVTAQGTANAAAAEAADASTLFYNTAGLANLKKHQVAAALNLVMPTIKYSDAQARYYTGEEITHGSRSGKITPNAVVAPHFYGAYKLNDRATVGVGMYVPFASSTEYKKDSVLRYNINQLGLTSIAVEPALAIKATEKHSVGVGVIAQYSKAKLRKYADWSSAVPAQAAAVPLPALGGASLNQLGGRPNFTAHADMKGDDWGFGYQLSWLYDINDRARIGANYRSKVTHNLKGHAEWTADGAVAAKQMLTGAAQQRGYPAKEDASVKIVTPESLSLHGMLKANDKVNLFADVTYTRHSRFKNVEVKFANPKTVADGSKSSSTTIRPNWRDTFKVAVGGSYQLSKPLQLRAGLAFDQSPVRNAESRLNTLPDGNRIWFSAGMKYTLNPNHEFDVAYSHIHINDTVFKGARATGNDVDSKGETSAKFKNYANIIGMQYIYRF